MIVAAVVYRSVTCGTCRGPSSGSRRCHRRPTAALRLWKAADVINDRSSPAAPNFTIVVEDSCFPVISETIERQTAMPILKH